MLCIAMIVRDSLPQDLYTMTSAVGPFIYNVGKFLGFLDPLRKNVLCTKDKKQMEFSNPLPP